MKEVTFTDLNPERCCKIFCHQWFLDLPSKNIREFTCSKAISSTEVQHVKTHRVHVFCMCFVLEVCLQTKLP